MKNFHLGAIENRKGRSKNLQIFTGKDVIVTDRGLGLQVSYGPGPCSRKTERAKRARSSCDTDQVRN